LILEEVERHRLLVEWSSAQAEYPRHLCVHELFAEQAGRSPDAIAVAFGAEALTYAELDRKANQLAHHLLKLGVGLETTVGLCVERSLELVVAKLGILKAGAACLPMATTFPQERIAFLLDDTGARVLLTLRQVLPRLPQAPCEVVCLDRDWQAISEMPAQDPRVEVGPANLSYVIHTSGSTGVPKGVLITHRGVVRNLMAENPFSFSAEDTVLQYAPLTFDAATYEIFGALLAGARLAIPDPGELSLEELGSQMKRHGVTAAWLGAALFHQMVEYRIEDLRGLRKIVSGGESLSVRHVTKVLRELPECELVNGYGPTENTMFSTAWHVHALSETAANVPIGHPAANCTLYVLDGDMNLVPAGEAGEVYVGGDGLARGYRDRPELTAAKFLPHPFSPLPGERLYRSGDLGRFLPGGEVEFLGRIDRLVKIQGFRIELGEIEAALLSHPDIGECVVSAPPEPATGHRRLVAYYVARRPRNPGELRAYLKERLPEHMVPGIYVPLERFPVTTNGKVDHRALPNPSPERPDLGVEFVAPRSDIEETLAGIWQEILGFHRVGVHDNFADLGGHPLLGTLIVSRVNEAFGLHLPLRALLEHRTIAEMASRIEALREAPPARHGR
jgi:amino acid adenylation domain-containing protein